jgi:hypothetical protein
MEGLKPSKIFMDIGYHGSVRVVEKYLGLCSDARRVNSIDELGTNDLAFIESPKVTIFCFCVFLIAAESRLCAG